MKDDVDKMKHRIKSILIPFMLLATLFLVTACSGEHNAYNKHDSDGFTVSVRYDANGGVFTGTSQVMVDSFDISKLEKDPQTGMVNLKLLDPSSEERGDWKPTNGNLVLAGWYAKRTESLDSEGNVVYSYDEKFDFDGEGYPVDPTKTYSAAEPVVTLYAVWVPKFEIEFVSKETGETLNTIPYNPVSDKLVAPDWNENTGKLDMGKFPNVTGKTFAKAYYEDGREINMGDVLTHTGHIDKNGNAVNPKMRVLVEYDEGNWYHIYAAKQLNSIGDAAGHYVICADLDFSDKGAYWPAAFLNGDFSGTIEGNGHTIKNVKVEQSDTWSQTGLFGTLVSGASIQNVTFDNVNVFINKGTRTPGSSYGVLAGTVESGVALKNIAITNSKLIINADTAYWLTEDYAIGLLCGMGSFAEGSDLAAIDLSGITCEKAGSKDLQIVVDGNTVTLVAG